MIRLCNISNIIYKRWFGYLSPCQEAAENSHAVGGGGLKEACFKVAIFIH